MRHVHHTQLRWSDPDMLGHLNHARFLSLFEDARMSLAAASPTGQPGAPDSRGCIAARVAVDYLAQVTYEPGLAMRVETWVGRIGRSSWTLWAEMYGRENEPVARCECVLVAFSYRDDKSRPLDDDERDFWSGYVEA